MYVGISWHMRIVLWWCMLNMWTTQNTIHHISSWFFLVHISTHFIIKIYKHVKHIPTYMCIFFQNCLKLPKLIFKIFEMHALGQENCWSWIFLSKENRVTRTVALDVGVPAVSGMWIQKKTEQYHAISLGHSRHKSVLLRILVTSDTLLAYIRAWSCPTNKIMRSHE